MGRLELILGSLLILAVGSGAALIGMTVLCGVAKC